MPPLPDHRTQLIERLGAPDQLESLVSHTRPRAWLALAALWVLVAGFGWWAVRGTLTTLAVAPGVVIAGAVEDVAATAAGRVRVLTHRVGDSVRVGEVVAEVDQPELELALAAAVARRAELARTAEQLRTLAARTYDARRTAAVLESTRLERTAREQDTVVAALEQRVADERGLVDRGLLSADAALASRQALYTARDAASRTRVAMRTATATLAAAEAEREAAVTPSEQAVRDADRDIARLRADITERARLRSSTSGVIVERLVERGDVLASGQAVYRVRSASDTASRPSAGPTPDRDRALRVVAFVTANEGKRVRPGMSVLVSPSNSRPEDDGYLTGEVAAVSEAPVSPQALRSVLRNDAVATSVAGGGAGAPFRVDVTLAAAKDGRGLAWTTGDGAHPLVATGTPARAWIVVESRAPISLVLPALRKRLQIGVVGE